MIRIGSRKEDISEMPTIREKTEYSISREIEIAILGWHLTSESEDLGVRSH